MAHYVVLDTSIYRELGFRFHENLDYRNLCSFTMNTDGEVLLSNIVLEEFCSFYETNLVSKIGALKKSENDLHRDPYFGTIKINTVEIDAEFEKALKNFRESVMN